MSPKEPFMAANIDTAKIAAILKDCADKYVLPRFNKLKDHEIITKTSKDDLVTDADRETEAALAKILTTLYPGSVVIGEEGVFEGKANLDELKKKEGIVWVIDPVDGTRNFVQGRPEFSIMLACVVNGETRYGWIHDVLEAETAIASKGGGAWYKGQKLQVANDKPIEETNGYIGKKYLAQDHRAHVNQEAGKVKKLGTISCASHEYLRMAQGKADFGIYSKIKPWDHLAGVLFIQESGGYVAKWDKTPYTPKDTGGGILVASSKALWQKAHDLLIKGYENTSPGQKPDTGPKNA